MRVPAAALLSLLAVFAGSPVRASADALVARGAAAARAGRSSEAAASYAGWLELHRGAAGAAAVFLKYFSVESDLGRLLEISRAFLADGQGRAGSGAAFLRIARLLDVAGRIEEARDAYVAALREGASSALVPAALLSVKLNDADGFRAVVAAAGGTEALAAGTGPAAAVPAARPSGADLVAALDLYAAGNRAGGSARLVEIASGNGDPDLKLKAMWILSQGAPDPGIVRTFAGSPEAAIAAAGTAAGGGVTAVRLQASPSGGALFESFAGTGGAAVSAPESAPAADSPTPTTAADPSLPLPSPPAAGTAAASVAETAASAAAATPRAPTYAVQAGTFQVKENADELANDLGRKGFVSQVVADNDSGRTRFRVLTGTGLAAPDAQALLKQMQQAGYSGLVVAEKPVSPPSSQPPSG